MGGFIIYIQKKGGISHIMGGEIITRLTKKFHDSENTLKIRVVKRENKRLLYIQINLRENSTHIIIFFTTSFRVIKRHEDEITVKIISGSGKIAQIMTPQNIKKLTKMFNFHKKISQQQASRKFYFHSRLIYKTLQKYTDIKYHKKAKIPKHTKAQKIEVKRKCGIFFQKYKKSQWIVDDTSYFTLSHGNINGNNSFTQTMFLKLLKNGISSPYFQESVLTVNQEIYLNQCIKKQLLSVIKKYHKDRDYIFLLNLASPYYARSVTNFLNEKQIQYFQKEDNQANVPECRIIEDFWSNLKGQIYQNNLAAQSLEKLQMRIKLSLKRIDKNLIKNIISSISNRLNLDNQILLSLNLFSPHVRLLFQKIIE
ncbi:hypothetical protein ABPG74_018974 [Tetrahymena malaccensis]